MTTWAQGDFGVDFLLVSLGNGQFRVDFGNLISDSRVVMQAVLGKLLGKNWWIPGAQVNLLAMHGEEFTPSFIDEQESRIRELVESEQQVQDVEVSLTCGEPGNGGVRGQVELTLSFSVNNDLFAFEIVVDGKSQDVFVSGLAA